MLCFSKNTPQAIQEEFKIHFRAQVICQREKYLGLPSLVGQNKQNTFIQLKEKLGNKPLGWKEKLLLNAGKEVLIKLVAQAILAYSMSCFKILDSICDNLASMVRSFWRGQNNGVNKTT